MDSKLNSKNSTLPFPVSSLTWDHFIYPRAGKSDKTISAYVEALAIGAQIVNNTNFGEINTLLSQGRDMDYIARHFHIDLALS